MSTPVRSTERSFLVVRLTLRLLAKGELSLARAAGSPRADLRRARNALACSPAEKRFARGLLERRTNLWIFRTDQHASGGDFIVVDASEPSIVARRALVLELKRGEPPRWASADMHQVRNAREGVAAVARASGALAGDARLAILIGDPDAIQRQLASIRHAIATVR